MYYSIVLLHESRPRLGSAPGQPGLMWLPALGPLTVTEAPARVERRAPVRPLERARAELRPPLRERAVHSPAGTQAVAPRIPA